MAELKVGFVDIVSIYIKIKLHDLYSLILIYNDNYY